MRPGTKTEAAKWWLIDHLTALGGEGAATAVLAAASAAGYPSSTLSQARKRAAVTSSRRGFGAGAAFVWRLDPAMLRGTRPAAVAYAQACERPTEMFPDGRTGTRNGYEAHRNAGEQPCRPCTDAHSAVSLNRRHAMPPDELDRFRKRNSASARRRRERDPAAVTAEKHRFMSANLAIIREAKSAPCADCRVSHPFYVMQFDHLDSEAKEFNIGVIGPTASRSRLIAEIAKCDVVCANCHAERTHQRRQVREAS